MFEAFSLSGFLSPLNTVSVNCIYTESNESSCITGTKKDVYIRICLEMFIGMSGVERFFGAVGWMVDTQLNFKCHNKSITIYGISYVDDVMCGIDYRFIFLKIFDLYFTFENVNSNESDYITSRSLSETLSKKIRRTMRF